MQEYPSFLAQVTMEPRLDPTNAMNAAYRRFLPKFFSRRGQRGLWEFIGLGLAIAVNAALAATAVSWYGHQMVTKHFEVGDARMLRILQNAANMYIQERYGQLIEQTRNGPVEIPIENVIDAFMFPDERVTTKQGGKIHLYLEQQPFGADNTPWLYAYMLPLGGQPHEGDRQGLAAREVGIYGFYTRPSQPGLGTGAYGKWQIDINSALAPLGVQAPPGVVGVHWPFIPGDTAFDYLHRFPVPGAPWLNRMNQDLDMNGNEIRDIGTLRTRALQFTAVYATHGQPCEPNPRGGARIARSDVDGNLAMCIYEQDINQHIWRNIGLMPNCTGNQLVTADDRQLRCAANPYYREAIPVYSECSGCASGVKTLVSWTCIRRPDNKVMDPNSAACQAVAPPQTIPCTSNTGVCAPPPPLDCTPTVVYGNDNLGDHYYYPPGCGPNGPLDAGNQPGGDQSGSNADNGVGAGSGNNSGATGGSTGNSGSSDGSDGGGDDGGAGGGDGGDGP